VSDGLAQACLDRREVQNIVIIYFEVALFGLWWSKASENSLECNGMVYPVADTSMV